MSRADFNAKYAAVPTSDGGVEVIATNTGERVIPGQSRHAMSSAVADFASSSPNPVYEHVSYAPQSPSVSHHRHQQDREHTAASSSPTPSTKSQRLPGFLIFTAAFAIMSAAAAIMFIIVCVRDIGWLPTVPTLTWLYAVAFTTLGDILGWMFVFAASYTNIPGAAAVHKCLPPGYFFFFFVVTSAVMVVQMWLFRGTFQRVDLTAYDFDRNHLLFRSPVDVNWKSILDFALVVACIWASCFFDVFCRLLRKIGEFAPDVAELKLGS